MSNGLDDILLRAVNCISQLTAQQWLGQEIFERSRNLQPLALCPLGKGEGMKNVPPQCLGLLRAAPL